LPVLWLYTTYSPCCIRYKHITIISSGGVCGGISSSSSSSSSSSVSVVSIKKESLSEPSPFTCIYCIKFTPTTKVLYLSNIQNGTWINIKILKMFMLGSVKPKVALLRRDDFDLWPKHVTVLYSIYKILEKLFGSNILCLTY